MTRAFSRGRDTARLLADFGHTLPITVRPQAQPREGRVFRPHRAAAR